MKIAMAAIVAFALVTRAQTAYADEATFAQVGSVQVGSVRAGSLQVPNFNWEVPTFAWQCADVTFPQEFGAKPNVIVSFGTLLPVSGATTYVNVQATNITTKGFTPVISPPKIPIGIGAPSMTINWVAVGAKK